MKKLQVLFLVSLLMLISVISIIACTPKDGDTNGDNDENKTEDTTAPSISGITISEVTENTTIISWTTDESATSNIEYGLTTSYGSSFPSSFDATADETSHTLTLTGLSSGRTYHFRVKSQDAAGNEALSDDYSFTTLPPSYTEFYILGPEHIAENYPTELMVGEEGIVIVGIVNHEGQETSYHMEVTIEGVKVGELGPLVLANGEKIEEQTGFAHQVAGYNKKVEFILYRNGGVEPYLYIYFWVDILNE